MDILESSIVPPDLKGRFATVSEALLEMSDEAIGGLRLNAPLVANKQRGIVPVEFVISPKDNSGLAIREWIVWKLREVDESTRDELFDSLFPPPGPAGFWSSDERVFRTRYMESSALDKPRISKGMAEQHHLQDTISYWTAVRQGRIFPYMDVSIAFDPPTLDKAWAFQPEGGDHLVHNRLLAAYRGCKKAYEYPLQPSVFRRFRSQEEGEQFNRLHHFVGSLITEFVWTVQRMTMSPHESESIIQHYKILPWSYMIDLSFDINVAKAFASVTPDEAGGATSCLYQCVLYNADFYDWGASLINNLPFQRPKVQNAISLIGLSTRMIDPTGVIVALTEHPFYYTETGTSWDLLGGPAYRLNGQAYGSPCLTEEEHSRLDEALYPQETHEGLSILRSVMAVVLRNIDRLGLDARVKEEVADRFRGLESELPQRRR